MRGRCLGRLHVYPFLKDTVRLLGYYYRFCSTTTAVLLREEESSIEEDPTTPTRRGSPEQPLTGAHHNTSAAEFGPKGEKIK